MFQSTQRPDLSDHTLDQDDFPHLKLTATVRRIMPDGSPIELPRYYPAWTGGSIGAGDIDSGRIMQPVPKPQPVERAVGMSMPYLQVPTIR